MRRFFTGNSGFIADHRCFDFCGVDGNNVTASLGCWENKFGRRFRLLRCDFRELVGVTIAINKRRELFFDRLCGDVEEVGANKNAVLFLVIGIERVDVDFYSRLRRGSGGQAGGFGSLLFGADPETRFCREKRGRVAAAKGLSVD